MKGYNASLKTRGHLAGLSKISVQTGTAHGGFINADGSVRKDVKLLGVGELTKKLTITVHAASASAKEKVEAAGGTLTLLKEPKVKKPKRDFRTGPKPAASLEDGDSDVAAESESEN